jgi:hypothetical protein
MAITPTLFRLPRVLRLDARAPLSREAGEGWGGGLRRVRQTDFSYGSPGALDKTRGEMLAPRVRAGDPLPDSPPLRGRGGPTRLAPFGKSLCWS